MKAKYFYTLLFIVWSLCPLSEVYAAFPVKHVNEITNIETADKLKGEKQNSLSGFKILLEKIRGERTFFTSHHDPGSDKNTSIRAGWPGIASFACASVAIIFALSRFFYIGWFSLSIISIILGGIGMDKNRKKKGFALAGFILGNISLITAFVYMVKIAIDSPYFNLAFNFVTFFVPYSLGVYPFIFQ